MVPTYCGLYESLSEIKRTYLFYHMNIVLTLKLSREGGFVEMEKQF